MADWWNSIVDTISSGLGFIFGTSTGSVPSNPTQSTISYTTPTSTVINTPSGQTAIPTATTTIVSPVSTTTTPYFEVNTEKYPSHPDVTRPFEYSADKEFQGFSGQRQIQDYERAKAEYDKAMSEAMKTATVTIIDIPTTPTIKTDVNRFGNLLQMFGALYIISSISKSKKRKGKSI